MRGGGETTWSPGAPSALLAGGSSPGGRFLRLLGLEALLLVLLVYLGSEVAATVALLLIGTLLLVALLLALPVAEHEPLILLVVAALAIRVTAFIAMHAALVTAVNPHGLLFPDSFGYDRVGANIAEHWRAGRVSRLEYQTAGFTIGYHYFVAAVYFLFGRAPLVATALNVLLSTSLVPLTFLLGRRLAGREVGLLAALFMAIWPPIIYWSVQLLKDAPIAFLLLTAALSWVAFVHRPRLIHLALAVVAAVPLVFLRTYMFLFWMIALAAGLYVWMRGRRRSFLALVLAAVVVAVGVHGVLEYSAYRLQGIEAWVPKLSAASTVTPGSLFGQVFYRSLGDVLAFYPLGVLRFLLTPLPWKADLLFWPDAVGSVLRYALLPFAGYGLVHIVRRERVAVFPILAVGFLAVSLYAAAFRGGGPRHMTQLYPYFFVFAAAGLRRFHHWPLPVAMVWIGLFAAGGVVGLITLIT